MAKTETPAPPLSLRVGGAFLGISLALFVLLLLSVLRAGWGAPFVVTPNIVCIIVAVALLGAYATTSLRHGGSKAQVIALGVAVAVVILGRLLPQTQLYVMGQLWVISYAVLALLCALVLRRSIMR